MPHLYLPSDHSDADLVLAADVAAAVSSADLYVTWTHDAGPGTPEVEAVVREETAPAEPNAFAELFVAMMRGIAALWQILTAPPRQQTSHPRVTGDARPAAGEPSL
jgi:hypothetical protein